MISSTALAARLADYLPRQRWFGAKDRSIELVRVVDSDVLRGGWPALVRVEVDVSLALRDTPPSPGGGDTETSASYQLMLGLRPTGQACEFLTGHEQAVVGEFETEQGQALVYDGLLDAELSLALLGIAAPGASADHVRPVGAEQSNTSLVYDDLIIMKVFRRLAPGANPEVEVTEALHRVGFAHVAQPMASWRRDGRDLAFVQRFLAGGTEGWAMALTSLRELYADPQDPGEAGGDFGAEAERLGEVTAELHMAMATAFGRSEGRGHDWADLMEAQIKRVLPGPTGVVPGFGDVAEAAMRVVGRLREVPDPGPAVRVHGDYHLGQVMRTDAGWFVLDFEGEPARPMEDRVRPSSPLKDVAGMLRSFHYAPAVAMVTQEDDMTGLARAWEAHNRGRFLTGYLRKADESGILPADPAARSAVLRAFELDKAVYELAYEQAHRPDWAYIPLEAVRRLTSDSGTAR